MLQIFRELHLQRPPLGGEFRVCEHILDGLFAFGEVTLKVPDHAIVFHGAHGEQRKAK